MVAKEKKLSFPQLEIVSRRRLDGGVVLESSIRNALSFLVTGDDRKLLLPGTPNIVPDAASFGDVVEIVETGAGLRLVDAQVVNEDIANKVPTGNIPTADQLLSTTYKSDSKCIIRIEEEAGSNKGNKLFFEHFSLQVISEPQEERFQVHEVFDGEKIFFFGRRPRFWTYSGIVVNAKDSVMIGESFAGIPAGLIRTNQSFADQLVRLFQDHYSGTKAVERKARVILTYEDIVVEGYMTNMSSSKNSMMPSAVNMTFTLFVTNSAFVGAGAGDGETLGDILENFNRQKSKNADAVRNLDRIRSAQRRAPQVEASNAAAKKESDDAAKEVEEKIREKSVLEQSIVDSFGDLESATNRVADAESAVFDAIAGGLNDVISKAESDLTEAQGELLDVMRDRQSLDAQLSVSTDDVFAAKLRKEQAQVLGEYAERSVAQLTPQGAQTLGGVNAVSLDELDDIKENGGFFEPLENNSFTQNSSSTGSDGAFNVNVDVIYPNGKKGDTRVKFETVTIRVKL